MTIFFEIKVQLRTMMSFNTKMDLFDLRFGYVKLMNKENAKAITKGTLYRVDNKSVMVPKEANENFTLNGVCLSNHNNKRCAF